MADAPISAAPQAASTPSLTPAQAADQLTAVGQNLVGSQATPPATPEAVEAKEAAINADPALSKAQKVEAKKMLKELKIKFDGKEYTEKLPFEIPDEPDSIKYMQDQLQMNRLARTRAQEATEIKNQVDAFLKELKSNPQRVLTDPRIGIDIKKMAVDILEKEVADSKKSPEQLEREKLQAQLKEMQEQREQERKELQEREFSRLQEQEFERYDTMITKAIETSDLPKSPYIVKKIADYMLMGLTNNIDVSPEDVMPLVRDEMTNDLKEMFAIMPDEVIEGIVGKDVINRIRKKSVAKAKAAPAVASKAKDVGAAKSTDAKPTSKEKAGYKDFFGF